MGEVFVLFSSGNESSCSVLNQLETEEGALTVCISILQWSRREKIKACGT